MTNQTCAPTNWMKKKKIVNKPVSVSIKAKIVKEIENSAHFSRMIGLDLNVFMTIRHYDIDTLSPEERNKRRERDLNRLKQYARDKGFTTAFIWSRESERGMGYGEHVHVLIHVPPELHENFKRIVKKNWMADVDIRHASYDTRQVFAGKSGNVIRYILKKSPQAAYKTSRAYRLGGPILGKRCGCSRNIDMSAQDAWRHSMNITPKKATSD